VIDKGITEEEYNRITLFVSKRIEQERILYNNEMRGQERNKKS